MGPDTGVIISSRIRLARNVKDAAFPGWAGQEESRRLSLRLFESLRKLTALRDAYVLPMDQVDPVDKLILQERHLISNELAAKDQGSGLVVTPDESIAIMVNEEDHLRLQSMAPGRDLLGIWRRLDAVDTELEQYLDYSFSPDVGYLTSCPSNVGTGLRASVMLHLPALGLLNELDALLRGLTKIGLAVRGSLGEGTEAWGNMFQVSNQITLGESEEDIIRQLDVIVSEVVEHELNARLRLLESRPAQLRDHVGRAFGILSQAHLLTSRETLDLLSGLRLGIELAIIGGVDVRLINELILLTQPGHLQRIMKQTIGPEERDAVRARIIRERLTNVKIG
jgi:protein arginine kinase